MSVCATCGKDNQAHYKFCLGCGADLTDGPPAPKGPRPSTTATHQAPTMMAEVPARPSTAPPVFGDMGPPMDRPTDPALPAMDDTLDVNPLSSNGNLPRGVEAALSGNSRACPSCNTIVAPGFRFCPSCGAPMNDAPEVPKPASTGDQRFVRPAGRTTAPSGKLVLVRPDGTEGGTHPLVEGENAIGRGTGTLFEADGYLSPNHAELVLNAAGLVVRDLNSLNGVFVKLTSEEELSHGDIFRIGQELLRFDAIQAPEPLDDGTEILGSPNPGYWGRLAVIVGADQDGSAFPLLGDATILGRERGDILFPEDGYVSGTHARVALRDNRFWLSDLNSSNGTFIRIRGERVVPTGSFVLMGQQLFRVAYA
jgi:hypothetical protein